MVKHTKIIATISDRRCEVDFIKSLFKAGMNAARLNSAHITTESAAKIVDNVRSVAEGIPCIIDTKGPEVRLTNVENDGFEVKVGDRIKMKGGLGKLSTSECVYLSYDGIINDIEVGHSVLIDDGELCLNVVEKNEDHFIGEVQNPGKIKSRKSVNIPGADIKLPSLTEKDRDFIDWAIEKDVEFIAHSFVRSKEDVIDIQEILDKKNSKVKIIAKIENQVGVDNIDEILEHAYGVMVARGDLGIEIPAEKIPGIQKMLIRKCIEHKKPVIVATQMLHTMIENPRPTRAEVSDIANAIYSRTDAIMLSGETAYGDYPVESVQTMTNIAKQVEASEDISQLTPPTMIDKQIPAFLAQTAVRAMDQLNTKAVVTDTLTGRTARYLSAFRGTNTVYAACYDHRTRRELALSYGVYSNIIGLWDTTDEFKSKALNMLIAKGKITENDLVLIMGGNFNPNTGVSFIDISAVKTLLTKQKPG